MAISTVPVNKGCAEDTLARWLLSLKVSRPEVSVPDDNSPHSGKVSTSWEKRHLLGGTKDVPGMEEKGIGKKANKGRARGGKRRI
jgi:hypothetical protein